jgi:hypothetical protein
MIVGSSQLWKKNYYAAFFKQMPNFNLLLTVTSDLYDILFELFISKVNVDIFLFSDLKKKKT